MMIEIVATLGGGTLLLIIGIIFGTAAERAHYRELVRREQSAAKFIRTQSQLFLQPDSNQIPVMICAETVVANDYFKRFQARFRKFFGGEIGSYNTLLERARRETLLRIIEQATAKNCNAICNLRLEPADVSGNIDKKGKSMICIVGSATAYRSGLGSDPNSLDQPPSPNQTPVDQPLAAQPAAQASD